jgi:hypothetical protein
LTGGQRLSNLSGSGPVRSFRFGALIASTSLPLLQSGFVTYRVGGRGEPVAQLTEGGGHLTIMVCETSEQRGGRRGHRGWRGVDGGTASGAVRATGGGVRTGQVAAGGVRLCRGAAGRAGGPPVVMAAGGAGGARHAAADAGAAGRRRRPPRPGPGARRHPRRGQRRPAPGLARHRQAARHPRQPAPAFSRSASPRPAAWPAWPASPMARAARDAGYAWSRWRRRHRARARWHHCCARLKAAARAPSPADGPGGRQISRRCLQAPLASAGSRKVFAYPESSWYFLTRKIVS